MKVDSTFRYMLGCVVAICSSRIVFLTVVWAINLLLGILIDRDLLETNGSKQFYTEPDLGNNSFPEAVRLSV